MGYHIALSRFIDLQAIKLEAAEGLRPRHAMGQLAERLDAQVHSPCGERPLVRDILLSKLVGSPQLWAYARALVSRLGSHDVIYCPDEAIGLPLAALCSGRGARRPKVVVMVHNIDRPRTRLALKINAKFRSADAFLAVSSHQVRFLREKARINPAKTHFIYDQTDLDFFRPGPTTGAPKPRPVLVSAGLEQRDYRVVADAVANLDVDVKITGFSADTRNREDCFPDRWPDSISRRRYEWPELAELYRDADAVLVTLKPNLYAAGITTILEGMASARPVIVTRTVGLEGYLNDTDALTVIGPSNSAALVTAIKSLLDDPARAVAMGQRGHEIARANYSSEAHVDQIAKIMETLSSRS